MTDDPKFDLTQIIKRLKEEYQPSVPRLCNAEILDLERQLKKYHPWLCPVCSYMTLVERQTSFMCSICCIQIEYNYHYGTLANFKRDLRRALIRPVNSER